MNKDSFPEKVYDTINGFLTHEFCVKDVENMFEPGKPCEALYRQMILSRERLAKRTNLKEDDTDIEGIIVPLLAISKIVGVKMFEYGRILDKKDL